MAKMSDWKSAASKRDYKNLWRLRELEETKLQDNERLVQSKLPTFPRKTIKCSDFCPEDFNDKEKLVCLIPKHPGLTRKHCFADSYEQAYSFIQSNLQGARKEDFDLIIIENKPTDWGGVIISNNQRTVAEASPEGLEAITNNTVIPLCGVFFQDFYNFRKMHWLNNIGPQTQEGKRVIWNALNYLREDKKTESNFPYISFKQGYFEWVRTKTGKIIFLDYKTNPEYLI